MHGDLTLETLIGSPAISRVGKICLLAPNRDPLTFGRLDEHLRETVDRLRSLGVGRPDRVAIVLPNGPEMATAFLAVASGAVAAPVNPAYKARDCEFTFGDLAARAVILPAGADVPARAAARTLGIPVLELESNPDSPAGLFRLACAGGCRAAASASAGLRTPADRPRPDDGALVLHTSGTTSRPKIVPLSHANLCASARNIARTLALAPEDRCLNVMPLFHIHGLVAGLVASLGAGGSVVCTPGFRAESFLDWLKAFAPTWYTAVPTMHQAVLAEAEAAEAPVTHSLRFVRSSSAALPVLVLEGLERALGVPVIESYGMTEAAHQMTSNLLPPGERRPGTVGVAAGPEVAVMDDEGRLEPAGRTGEIVIRGENVTSGYEGNDDANRSAFTNGWFRTGDVGVLDADRYLTITGRRKEMVNRGGENIAPREIDEALMDHPAVRQAVAFAVPHPTLGEDLVAAVVVRDRDSVTSSELRAFAFARLPDVKVPTRIVIVDQIPKGPTGKLQRIGLAEALASKLADAYTPPSSPLEAAMARAWAEVLQVERVGIGDNFFALGGDSLSAAALLAKLKAITGHDIPPPALFKAPTIRELATLLEAGPGALNGEVVLRVQSEGRRTPLFCVPGHGGDVFTFLHVARHLGTDQPVYTFAFPDEARKDDHAAVAMIRDLATHFIGAMKAIQPRGPYLLAGDCLGGQIAFEMAQQLHTQGETADLVAIIDAFLAGSIRATGFGARLRYHYGRVRAQSFGETCLYVTGLARNRLLSLTRRYSPGLGRKAFEVVADSAYIAPHYPGRITLFRPARAAPGLTYDAQMGWGGLAAETEVHDIPSDRDTVFKEPDARVLAAKIRECLDRVGGLGQACA